MKFLNWYSNRIDKGRLEMSKGKLIQVALYPVFQLSA
jgi:hypothetical protein